MLNMSFLYVCMYEYMYIYLYIYIYIYGERHQRWKNKSTHFLGSNIWHFQSSPYCIYIDIMIYMIPMSLVYLRVNLDLATSQLIILNSLQHPFTVHIC